MVTTNARRALRGTPYRLVREIGRGGMGNVYEVEHRRLGKLFVMKVLREDMAHRDDFALRLEREGRMLATLEHPAIVAVSDAGRTSAGLPYFVMERLEGETLASALAARGSFQAVKAATLMSAVLLGLEAAHAAGVTHRDIKPANLFLTACGPKILDFGIARKRWCRDSLPSAGMAIGTPRYMAPEQAAGLAVDGRADIYACALVLFEMIAGRDPYWHLRDSTALVDAQVNIDPPRLGDRCDVPVALDDLLAKWLSKDPKGRPPSARAAGLELRALLWQLDSHVPRGRRGNVVDMQQWKDTRQAAGDGRSDLERRQRFQQLLSELPDHRADIVVLAIMMGCTVEDLLEICPDTSEMERVSSRCAALYRRHGTREELGKIPLAELTKTIFVSELAAARCLHVLGVAPVQGGAT